MGRATYGVIGVRLSEAKDDHVVTMAPVTAKFPHLLTLTSTGYGKRSPFTDYRQTRRGAHGVRTIVTGGRNGSVVAVLPVREDQEVLVTTQGGVTIRVPVASIRAQGRNTMGVRIIRIEERDAVKDAVALDPPAEEPENGAAEPPKGLPPAVDGATDEPPEADAGMAEDADDAPS